jgi:hypothetical protein
VFRLYDPDRQVWLEGRPGEHRVLQTRLATVDLARTHFAEVAGAAPPTVDISWAVTLKHGAAGDLQQYLRVVDDTGAATSWDKVGLWWVTANGGSSSPYLAGAAVVAAVLAVIAVVTASRARRRRAPLTTADG